MCSPSTGPWRRMERSSQIRYVGITYSYTHFGRLNPPPIDRKTSEPRSWFDVVRRDKFLTFLRIISQPPSPWPITLLSAPRLLFRAKQGNYVLYTWTVMHLLIYGLLDGAAIISDYSAEWRDDWWIMNWKGCVRKQSQFNWGTHYLRNRMETLSKTMQTLQSRPTF
jgi:hypothetical protein